MARPAPRSILYRLIEAGQLTHKSLVAPLIDRGLEPGDDAVLFALHGQQGLTESALAEALGTPVEALCLRLRRLHERGLVARRETEREGEEELALTERGERLSELLAAHWTELEGALLGELDKKKRRALGRMLRRFVELLRL